VNTNTLKHVSSLIFKISRIFIFNFKGKIIQKFVGFYI